MGAGITLGVTIVYGLIVAAIVAVMWAYATWLKRGMSPRTFTTAVAGDTIRRAFVDRIAGASWKVVDDGNPLVVQRSLVTGIRQQLALRITTSEDGRQRVWFGPQRWVTSGGIPKKAHTLRLRMNAFEDAMRALDPSIDVQRGPLKGA